MSLPTLNGTGRALDDPDLRFSSSGVAVCKLRLAFNSRKRQDDGTWVDDKTCYLDATAFKQTAENIASSVTRGTEVVVSGQLVTEQWEDRNGGGKRSKVVLLIESIGPSLRFNPATVQKMDRSGGSGQPNNGGQSATRQQSSGAGFSGDPWANAGQPGNGGQSSFDDEPPF